MLEIYNGRDRFYQWDVGQKIIVDDTILTVHYDNGTGDALVCPVYEYNGQYVADVPNLMLQTVWAIRCYAYCGECVRAEKVYEVEKRSRPDDYIYTETETLRYSLLLDMLNATNDDLTTVEHTLEASMADLAAEHSRDMETVEQQLAATNADVSAYIASNDNKVNYLWDACDGLNTTTLEIETKHSEDVAEIEAELNKLNNGYNTLRNTVNTNAGTLNNLMANYYPFKNDTTAQLAAINADVAAANDRITETNSKLMLLGEHNSTEIKGVEKIALDAAAEVNSLTNDMAVVERNIVAVAADVEKQAKAFNSHKEEADATLAVLGDRVGALTNKAAAQDAKIQQVENSIDSYDAVINAVSNDMATVKADAAECVEAVEAQAAQVSKNKSDIATLDGRLDYYDNGYLPNLDQRITNNQTMINANGVRIDRTNERVAALETANNEHDTRITNLEKSGGSGTGGGGGIPAGEPGQYLITDDSGNAVWADEKTITATPYTYIDNYNNQRNTYQFSIPDEEIYNLVSTNEIANYEVKLIEDKDVYKLTNWELNKYGNQTVAYLQFMKTYGVDIRTTYTKGYEIIVYSNGSKALHARTFGSQSHDMPELPAHDGNNYYLTKVDGTDILEWTQAPTAGSGEKMVQMAMEAEGQFVPYGEIVTVAMLMNYFEDDAGMSAIYDVKMLVLSAVGEELGLIHLYNLTTVDMIAGNLIYTNGKDAPIVVDIEGNISYMDV